jgi:PmbA protein
MNFKKFFEIGQAQGLDSLELNYHAGRDLNISVFHGEVSQFSVADAKVIAARGIYNGKFGSASSEKIEACTPAYLVEEIKENAKVNEEETPAIIFPGSKQYKRKNMFNPAIEAWSTEDKIALLLKIEDHLKKADSRISDVEEVQYSESMDESIKMNSFGLKLKEKRNYFVIYASVIVKDKGDTKTGYKIYLGNNPQEFDLDQFVAEVVKNAVSKLGGAPCKSKKYPVVLNPRVTASLLSAYMSNAGAELVQKHTSLFEGKVNQVVASKKITIIEDPLAKNVFYTYFDSEGVATYKKTFVDKGVLKQFAYNLGTAAKDGVESTGNGQQGGAKIGIGFFGLTIKPGRKSEDEVLGKIKEGVYLTEVQGLHAGLNPRSGNFSLQASGFMIRDGKLAEPVNLITVAGNLVDMFKNVKEVANNSELQLSSTNTPSILVSKLAISGK